jgi:hypothetical protein
MSLPYTGFMARGWESKAIEDQIAEKAEKAAETQASQKKRSDSTQKIEQQGTRQGLIRAKERTVTMLTSVRSDKDRAVLEQTLADLESRLRELD